MFALFLLYFLQPEASPTPLPEVIRVINLLPKPQVAFVDYGCGDARWCITASQHWGCKSIGIELDPVRATTAQQRVESLGLDHLVIIIQGDATTANVNADVGVAYLYPEPLLKLRPQIEPLRSFASYLHQPPVPSDKNGDTYIYTKGKYALWEGKLFTAPECDSLTCQMCNSIRAQLAPPKGHYEVREQVQQICHGRWCEFVKVKVNVWVQE